MMKYLRGLGQSMWLDIIVLRIPQPTNWFGSPSLGNTKKPPKQNV